MVEMLTDLGNTGTKPNLKSEKKEKIWELYWLGRFLKKEVIK